MRRVASIVQVATERRSRSGGSSVTYLNGERGQGSTRWVPAGERLSSSARGKQQRPRSGHRWFGLPVRRRTEHLHLVIRYRGGSECWYLIEARGRHGVFPGVVALHDVMDEINQQR